VHGVRAAAAEREGQSKNLLQVALQVRGGASSPAALPGARKGGAHLQQGGPVYMRTRLFSAPVFMICAHS